MTAPAPAVLIDACVLYPTVMREMLLGVAAQGFFRPLWSARILEEWARAAARLGAEEGEYARAEIALLQARWPGALVPPAPQIEVDLALPDANDIHVLAVAIWGGAQELLTLNLKDFPTRTLAAHGLIRRDPDGFLREMLASAPDEVGAVASAVQAEAARLSGRPQPLRALFKKARLPRFAKALDQL